MEPRREDPKAGKGITSIFLVSLMLFSLVPALATPVVADDSGRDANIRLTISPSAQTVNPGETAEYTVRVYNDGANPVSVNLAANNEQDCTGFSAAIGQIGQPIESGDNAETFLNVTLAQNAEGSCITTVNANANEQPTPPDQPGAPAQKSADVETTSGDGSGSTLFGVELTIDAPVNPTWNGEDEITWDVEVENTGRVQETVELTVDPRSGSGCKSDGSLSIDVSPSSVQIDNGSSEWVTVTVQVPEGKESDKYCWEIEGVVTNDQNPNGSASDVEEFSLFIPELKKCDVTLSKSSLSLEPGETGTLLATFSNEGNTDWQINVGFNGSKSSWAGVDGASSGMLNYDNGNGEKEFTIEITPDDSVEANSQNSFYIEGKDGNFWKCRGEVTVTVGQSRGATISLGNTGIYDIPPGQDRSTTLTVTNTGNGPDTFRVAASSLPAGWSVTLESSTISTQSRFNNAEKSGTIEVTISLPLDALATEEVTIVFSVLPQSSGGAYDTAELVATVKAVHAMSGETPADDQTGRSDTTVQFPIVVNNDGNTLDRFRFSVISQTAQPAWGKHFETEDGTIVTEVDIPARGTITMYLVVSIDGEEELESTRLTVRVTNLGDNNNGDSDENGVPDNQLEFMFRAILSDRDFAMDVIIMNNADDLSRNEVLILPPGGTQSFDLKVTNTGDLTDEAIFDFSGLSGIASRELFYRGMPVEGPITIPKGWGAFNETTGTFYYDGNSPLLGSTEDKIFDKIVDNEIVDSHIPMPFYAIITLEIEVNNGAENGDGGLLELVVTSVSNAANRSGKVTFSLSVETVLDAELIVLGDNEKDITFGQIGKSPSFEVDVMNTGNIESEFKIFSSVGVRGWNVILGYESGANCQDKGDHILCMIPAGETVQITAKVNPPGGETAEVEDVFTFTLSVEPTEIGLAGRENIKLTVNGEPEEFALNSLITPNVLYGIGALVLIGFASLVLRRRK
ncbi:MAG: hypothetical protein CM15mP71_3840 [Candidatus Poseidoniales archaeon]|nr:MAG: hypothetical protein CM15mP71_3840 [Candidatus Poseidoniales archaeon]